MASHASHTSYTITSNCETQLNLTIINEKNKICLQLTVPNTANMYEGYIDDRKGFYEMLKASIDKIDGFAYECEILDDDRCIFIITSKYIDDINVELRQNKINMDEKLLERIDALELKVMKLESLIDSSHTKTISITEQWNYKLNKLIKYISENEKAPNCYSKDRDVAELGKWYVSQKQHYKKGTGYMKDSNINAQWEKFLNDHSNINDTKKVNTKKCLAKSAKKKPSMKTKIAMKNTIISYIH